MKFFAATVTAFLASAALSSAAPAPDTVLPESPDLDRLHTYFQEALDKVEAAQAAEAEVEKRQPGGTTCTFLGDQACYASCIFQTGCGGYCASNNICTCYNC
ncbi:uncharacterized protein J7T54_008478 [Emericellopsis cladophorae]|uniref:Invertebrate defensins family profile domain-containing protein n=1 Tax=Emericellopsis cladophorae TaxID=2686198 RepID=A0A9P9XV46_9HYPO|nr:uncharacterized protein J7T54_008478 [Emericellopsis cladophorae]KAI6778300.1 hypothetical protein J7T54_008478 [Emericellopsis cladophorae]